MCGSRGSFVEGPHRTILRFVGAGAIPPLAGDVEYAAGPRARLPGKATPQTADTVARMLGR